MANISAIGIKKLYYGDPIAAVTKAVEEGDATSGYSALELKALIPTLTEVKNVHGDTWNYEEAEANITRYKNQLTGKPYRQDSEAGETQISFTIGQYDYKTKADLQGGVATASSWSRPAGAVDIRKTVVALTNDDIYILMPNAAIVGRGATTDNAIGLAVGATAMEPTVEGLEIEKWFDKKAVDEAAAG